MDLPEINNENWTRIIPPADEKSKGDTFWLPLPNGEEKRIGLYAFYIKKTKPEEVVETYAEINIFEKGIVAQNWHIYHINNAESFYWRIKKNEWLIGKENNYLKILPLYKDKNIKKQFCGVILELETDDGKKITIEIKK